MKTGKPVPATNLDDGPQSSGVLLRGDKKFLTARLAFGQLFWYTLNAT